MYSNLPSETGLNILNDEVKDNKNYTICGWGNWMDKALLNKVDNEGNTYSNIFVEASIIGLNGTIFSTYNFSAFNAKEIENLNKIFNENSNSITSLVINNRKYQIINYKKGFSIDLLSANKGGTIAKTNLAFIVGIYDKNEFYRFKDNKFNQCLKVCNYVVEDCAKILIKQNY